MNQPRIVAVLLFDEVEVLDFCGPYEVFSVAGRRQDRDLFHVHTVAEDSRPVLARGGLSVNPHHTLDDAPAPDILVVPGGFGTRREMNNAALTGWIAARAQGAEIVFSVCTGALLLARAGLLDGKMATTHHGAFDLLEQVAPGARVERDRRYVDNGQIILSAGISAGIDAALYIVSRLHGLELARETARYMEYDWRAESTGAVERVGQ